LRAALGASMALSRLVQVLVGGGEVSAVVLGQDPGGLCETQPFARFRLERGPRAAARALCSGRSAAGPVSLDAKLVTASGAVAQPISRTARGRSRADSRKGKAALREGGFFYSQVQGSVHMQESSSSAIRSPWMCSRATM